MELDHPMKVYKVKGEGKAQTQDTRDHQYCKRIGRRGRKGRVREDN